MNLDLMSCHARPAWRAWHEQRTALKTQVWTAVCAYVLVAIVKKRLNLDMSLYTILQILSVSLFEKTPILRALSHPPRQFGEGVNHNQLELFNI